MKSGLERRKQKLGMKRGRTKVGRGVQQEQGRIGNNGFCKILILEGGGEKWMDLRSDI
jgi:hypothetical protein